MCHGRLFTSVLPLWPQGVDELPGRIVPVRPSFRTIEGGCLVTLTLFGACISCFHPFVSTRVWWRLYLQGHGRRPPPDADAVQPPVSQALRSAPQHLGVSAAVQFVPQLQMIFKHRKRCQECSVLL